MLFWTAKMFTNIWFTLVWRFDSKTFKNSPIWSHSVLELAYSEGRCFLKRANPGLFLLIFVFSKQFLQKNVGFRGVQTWIVLVEASMLTTLPPPRPKRENYDRQKMHLIHFNWTYIWWSRHQRRSIVRILAPNSRGRICLFFKLGLSRTLFIYFHLFNTVESKQMFYKSLPITGFEPRISGVGGDRSTNWAITAARDGTFLIR